MFRVFTFFALADNEEEEECEEEETTSSEENSLMYTTAESVNETVVEAPPTAEQSTVENSFASSAEVTQYSETLDASSFSEAVPTVDDLADQSLSKPTSEEPTAQESVSSSSEGGQSPDSAVDFSSSTLEQSDLVDRAAVAEPDEPPSVSEPEKDTKADVVETPSRNESVSEATEFEEAKSLKAERSFGENQIESQQKRVEEEVVEAAKSAETPEEPMDTSMLYERVANEQTSRVMAESQNESERMTEQTESSFTTDQNSSLTEMSSRDVSQVFQNTLFLTFRSEWAGIWVGKHLTDLSGILNHG